MVATLQSRKDALEAKIIEKTAELKRLCLQEADLTGVVPPETPLDPGEPPPTVRRRIGTSFSFPQSLINNLNGSDDASLGALELECKVQTNIAEAALTLANDPAASKSVRRKHRLMYRQSQRHLMELETRLSLLKQGKHQPMKPHQIKKKPRPNTTTVDHMQLMREFKGQKVNGYYSNGAGSWPVRTGVDCYGDEELRQFSSLHRPPRSSGTSQSSNSPRLSARDLSALNSSGLPDQYTMTSSLSQPNIQELKPLVDSDVTRELSRSERRSSGRRQWDSQSAGGTLLPNQTYPDSHQPNLNRTQSLGSVDGQRQNKEKEKEWYETSLDSAPSPPLRTSSRLPTSARMLYHMQELQIRDAVNRSLVTPRPHPSLTRTRRATPVEEVTALLQGTRIGTPPLHPEHLAEPREATEHPRYMDNYPPTEHAKHLPDSYRKENPYGTEHPRRVNTHQTSEYSRYIENQRHESLVPRRSVENLRHLENRQSVDSHRSVDPRQTPEYTRPIENTRPVVEPRLSSDAVYIDIPDDEVDSSVAWRPSEGTKTPTQPYYHTGVGWAPPVPGLPEVHPPHAVTQEEITFDTVVPFESPQNHTVVQAGIWQPYREVTKPFEMSDFYKYSTKFRPARQSPSQQPTPEPSRRSPAQAPLLQRVAEPLSPNTVVGVYQPLRPMTCQPLERRAPPTPTYMDPSVSAPKIV